MESGHGGWRSTGLLFVVLAAFASNSLLNRAALVGGQIDWASFTIIRLLSGALILGLFLGVRHGKAVLPRRGDCVGAMSLFAYAGAFSAAYISLDAGVGALILFPAGQISIQLIGLTRSIIPTRGQLAGAAIALTGLVVLIAPGATAPPLWSGLLMAFAGIAWGFYTWAGKGVADFPLATARYFVGAGLLALLLVPFAVTSTITWHGVLLAVISGAFTSALGYVLWYHVLARISIATAAVSQLSVPAIAGLGGVLLLGEVLTMRMITGGMIIFAGIGLAIWASAGRKAA
ncbi:DMT family transporter [Parasphingorhabdus flavimaris]|uniref:DMT family transporter n=1 Tax=Parasphingorhabdus flavimaris TaxID=266812 RepID=A0ABX2MY63_9SPHN|nr:DMT family transporter [Parasphingorhabdus flavimaris]NVD26387.1 DMT family transporter [Parasphingorhabdus flavimaris]